MKQDLTVVKEVDLEELVAQSEHDGVSGLEPLFDVDEPVVLLEFKLLLGHLFHFLVEMNHEPLQQEVFFLKISIFRHIFSFVTQDVLLLQGRILHKVDVPD